jgi:hypothetical protein
MALKIIKMICNQEFGRSRGGVSEGTIEALAWKRD